MKKMSKRIRRIVKKLVFALKSLGYIRTCKSCGRWHNAFEWAHLDGEDRWLIMSEGHCFDCAYWISQHRHKEGCDCLVVEQDGKRVHYRSHAFIRGGGFGGSLWIYKFNGHVRSTRDMWYQGEIPEHLYQLFPVNARFLPTPAYNYYWSHEKLEDAPF